MSRSSKSSSKLKATLVRPPDTVFGLLMELSVNYAFEQTDDFPDFAVQYFTRVREIKEAIRLAEAAEASVSTELVSTVPDEDLSIPSQLVRHASIRGDSCAMPSITADVDTEFVQKPTKTRDFLVRSMRRSILFRTLDRQVLMEIIRAMQQHILVSGDFLLRQGEVTNRLYIVEKGELEAVVNAFDAQPRLLARYKRDSIFGEIAMMHIVASGASVEVIVDATLWSIDRLVFRHMVMLYSLKRRDVKRRLFSSLQIFRVLKISEREKLAEISTTRTYSKGSWLFRQGSPADGMYVLEQGMVLLTKPAEMERQTILKRLSRRQIFGEAALVSRTPRRMAAIAIQNVRVHFLSVEDLERILGPLVMVLRRRQEGYENLLLKFVGSKEFTTDLREPPRLKKIEYPRKKVKSKRKFKKAAPKSKSKSKSNLD